MLENSSYQFITDEMLITMSDEIEQFWQSGKDGEFHGVDEVLIKYKIFEVDNEKGAIVISSGRTECFIKYKEIVYNFSKILNYTVYIHDHRGQGFSDRMLTNPYKGYVKNFEDYVYDLKIFFDTVILKNSHNNLYLLAHSMGAGVSTLYIERFPYDFHAAVFTSPMHEPNIGMLGNIFCKIALLNRWLPKFLNFSTAYIPLQGDYAKKPFKENDPNIMTHNSYRYNELNKLYEEVDNNHFHHNSEGKTVKLGGVTWNWLVEAKNASKLMIRNAESIKIPVLVIQAGEDIVVTARGQNEFCKKVKSSNKFNYEKGNLFVIPGAYHEILIESDKYRLAALSKVSEFFRKYSR